MRPWLKKHSGRGRTAVIAAALFSLAVTNIVHAEPDYSDTEYWMGICTQSLAEADTETRAACQAFMEYQAQSSETMQQKLDEINAQIEQASQDILKFAEEARAYQAQADALNDDIAVLNSQIAVKEKKIEELQARIDENQGMIEDEMEKVKARMERQQQTMRLNQYLDLLMGAQTFEDLVRISNGLADITAYDQARMEALADEIEQFNQDKADLEKEKASLDEDRTELLNKQNELLVYVAAAQQAEAKVKQQEAELEAQGNHIVSNLAAIQEQMNQIAAALNTVAATAGWTFPVVGGHVNPYAGTWYYASGGVHLGADFVAALGTNVLAAGNGVILKSTDGCGYGYLGNGCGSAQGGSWGGGNQVYLLTIINDSLYAVKYCHLLAGTPIATGTIVSAGQVIAQVGSSGNSTGPHCHIEVHYLGAASDFASYAENWNGDMAFGCGWGSAGLNRLCENGVGAPCRIRPESVFGTGS